MLGTPNQAYNLAELDPAAADVNCEKLYLHGSVFWPKVHEYIFKEYHLLQELTITGGGGANNNPLPENLFVNNTKLRILKLEGSGMNNLPINLLKTLSELTEIHLYDNFLTTISYEHFQYNTKLEIIHLQRNGINACSLNMFSGLVQLRELYLGDNHLEYFSIPTKPMMNLQVLDISENYLVGIDNYHEFKISFPAIKLFCLENNFFSIPYLELLIDSSYHQKININRMNPSIGVLEYSVNGVSIKEAIPRNWNNYPIDNARITMKRPFNCNNIKFNSIAASVQELNELRREFQEQQVEMRNEMQKIQLLIKNLSSEQVGTEIQEHSVVDTEMMYLLDSFKKMEILTKSMIGDDYNGIKIEMGNLKRELLKKIEF